MDRTKTKYNYFTIRVGKYGGYDIVGWGVYPDNSVLAGQAMKVFINNYPTLDEAKAAYPKAQFSNQWTEPQVSLNHLPGEDDPVAGGMYPDDWD